MTAHPKLDPKDFRDLLRSLERQYDGPVQLSVEVPGRDGNWRAIDTVETVGNFYGRPAQIRRVDNLKPVLEKDVSQIEGTYSTLQDAQNKAEDLYLFAAPLCGNLAERAQLLMQEEGIMQRGGFVHIVGFEEVAEGTRDLGWFLPEGFNGEQMKEFLRKKEIVYLEHELQVLPGGVYYHGRASVTSVKVADVILDRIG